MSSSADFSAFGRTVYGTGADGYTMYGGQYGYFYPTSASQLYYVRQPWYDTQFAQWLSRDPIGYDGGDWNLYRYARNNPLKWVDPSGQQGVATMPPPTLGIGVGIGGGIAARAIIVACLADPACWGVVAAIIAGAGIAAAIIWAINYFAHSAHRNSPILPPPHNVPIVPEGSNCRNMHQVNKPLCQPYFDACLDSSNTERALCLGNCTANNGVWPQKLCPVTL